MANTSRKSAKGKAISSHPLFPAVIALWFGALFGLGSLAIRPGLIEGAVLKTGLDLIVPAAAPPLGVTARVLIALIMAALGAAIGAILALQINRRKAAMRDRQGEAANPEAAAEAEEAEEAMWSRREMIADGPAPRPIPALDEPDEAPGDPGLPLGRHRELAVDPAGQPLQAQEFASGPRGEPQIFDIAAMQLTPMSEAASPLVAAAPLDLGAFTAPVAAEPASFEQSDPADLGLPDLAERLKESMARRRAARASTAAEPVVIFPGQMTVPPAAPPHAFEASAMAIQGKPTGSATAVPTVDPAEAERALRTALANLQRISGAA